MGFKPDPKASIGPIVPTAASANAMVAVIIPHLNDAERLTRCLNALNSQNFDMSRTEIIVVDNGSDTEPTGAVADFPNVRLIRESTPGPVRRATLAFP